MIAQSIEEIRQEGIQKGRQEGVHEALVETAKRMLLDDFSEEKIKKLTGLSVEEIEKLKA